MLQSLKKTKQTSIYKFFIFNVFSLLYEIIWQYIINLKSKILYFYFLTVNKEESFYNFRDSPTKIIKNDNEFKKITNEINFELTDQLIDNAKKNFYLNFDKNKDIKDFSIDLTNHISSDLKKKIINFSTSKKNIKSVCKYLKVLPYLAKVKLYLNVPLENKIPKASMLWHRDDFGYKSLDLFLAVRKIDETNGPLHYVNNDSLNNLFLQIPDQKIEKIKGERNKHKLEYFEKFINKDQTAVFLADPGDGLWIDSFRVYHRGGHCSKNDRLMLRLSYQTPDNTRSNDLNNEYFYYDDSIKKKDINNIIKKHFFFGHISFFVKNLNLTKKLIFLYRLVSIKIKKR